MDRLEEARANGEHLTDGSFQLWTGHTQRHCTCGWSCIGTAQGTFDERVDHLREHNGILGAV